MATVGTNVQARANVPDSGEDHFPEVMRLGMARGPYVFKSVQNAVGTNDIKVLFIQKAFIHPVAKASDKIRARWLDFLRVHKQQGDGLLGGCSHLRSLVM